MANLRIEQTLAAASKENCEKHPKSNLAQYTNVPRCPEDFITQVSEEIEGRLTKKLSKEISRTESRSIATSRVSAEPANPGPLPNRSRDIPERTWHKPENE